MSDVRRRTHYNRNMHYVYVLFSSLDCDLYIGRSANLKSRIVQHHQGSVKSTKFRRPLQLIHYEAFINSEDAKAREVYLKSGAGHIQLRAKLKRTFKALPQKRLVKK